VEREPGVLGAGTDDHLLSRHEQFTKVAEWRMSRRRRVLWVIGCAVGGAAVLFFSTTMSRLSHAREHAGGTASSSVVPVGLRSSVVGLLIGAAIGVAIVVVTLHRYRRLNRQHGVARVLRDEIVPDG
jgi:multisubunit Na+/H+ antiporter MnhB subunit